MIYLVLATGISSGLVAGLLGLGGGILSSPLLLYSPTVLNIDGISVREVTGLTIVQGFSGALSGLARHRAYGYVSWPLVLTMGVPVGLGALAGSLLSGHVSESVILAVLGTMAALAAAMTAVTTLRQPRDEETLAGFSFNRNAAVAIAGSVGFAGGIVGQGGAFLLIPSMLFLLHIPTRNAIASSLGVTMFSTTAGLAGKIATAQVPPVLAAVLVAGVVPAAQIGGVVSRRVQPRVLRYVFGVVIALVAGRIWLDVFS